MSHKKIRIAFARINQETNALSPVKTTLEDFTSVHFLQGDALLAACQPKAQEVQSMFKNAELSGFVQELQRQRDVELLPLFSAWAVPNGPLSRQCFDTLCNDLVTGLRGAGADLPLDGLYLCLHGAMGVEGMEDPEGEIVRRVRAVVGSALPIVVTYDLHGNVTRRVMENVTALVAYATNPHRDHKSCGARAGRILLGAIQKTARPTMAWRSLPMLMGGGTTLDFFPPLLQIFRRMRALERKGEVLSASLLTCHPWNSNPELGWAVVVVTDGDPARAERLADELAERAWGTRHALPPRFEDADTAIERARGARLRRKLGAVVLSDASDVVSAGAPGENTALLSRLIDKAQGMLCYVPLRDPAVVQQLWSSAEGSSVTVSLGGKLDPRRSTPLTVNAVLERKTTAHGVGRTLILAVGTVKIAVVEGPPLAVRPLFFSAVGLDPWRADIIVVKNFFPFRMFFLPLSRLTIYVRTTGVTDFDAAHAIDFAGPMHPKDTVEDWHDADQRRRRGPADVETQRAA